MANQALLRATNRRTNCVRSIANIHLATWMLAIVVQLDVATPVWDHADMTEEELVTRLMQAAAKKKSADKRAKKLTDAAGEAFEVVVVEALTSGIKPAAVAKATKYSYETIRRIARKYELEPLREPTVTSRKPKPGGDSPA